MGPVLKTLLGIYLFIWTVVGILLITGGVLGSLQLAKVSRAFSDLAPALGQFSNLSGLTSGAANTGRQTNQAGGLNVTQEVDTCLTQELGENYQAEFQAGQEPSATDRAAFEKCGFTPPDDGARGGNPPSSPPKQ